MVFTYTLLSATSETPASVTYARATRSDRLPFLKLLLRERLNFLTPYVCDVEKCVVVARDISSGALIGGAKLGRMDSTDKETYQLSSVVVDEAYRSQGIGKALIQRALDLAPSKDATVFLTTLADRETLYSPFGFHVATAADEPVPASLQLEMCVGAVLFSAASLIVMVRRN